MVVLYLRNWELEMQLGKLGCVILRAFLSGLRRIKLDIYPNRLSKIQIQKVHEVQRVHRKNYQGIVVTKKLQKHLIVSTFDTQYIT